ncbi:MULTISPECIES: hypothetical protein [Chelativorans]|jgi:hypothetical protein|nr:MULTISPECIES: hypothetical protein [Chelativorans]
MIWRENYEIVWHSETTDDLEVLVRKDIASALEGLDSPENLIFHTVFLDESSYDNCPVVIVWGQEGDQRFHAEYHSGSSLVPIAEVFE